MCEKNDSNVNVHQNRFGYHPCDYETYQKLKTLHKAYWKAVYGLAEWFRWQAKQPHNRVLRQKIKDETGKVIGKKIIGEWNEPKYCPLFGLPDYKRGWMTIPEHLKDHGIIADYKNAKTPKDKNAVIPLKLSIAEIDKLFAAL